MKLEIEFVLFFHLPSNAACYHFNKIFLVLKSLTDSFKYTHLYSLISNLFISTHLYNSTFGFFLSCFFTMSVNYVKTYFLPDFLPSLCYITSKTFLDRRTYSLRPFLFSKIGSCIYEKALKSFCTIFVQFIHSIALKVCLFKCGTLVAMFSFH